MGEFAALKSKKALKLTNPFEDVDAISMEKQTRETGCLKKKTARRGSKEEQVSSAEKSIGQVYNDQPRFLFTANTQQTREKKEVTSNSLKKAPNREEMELESDSESQNVPEQPGSRHTRPIKSKSMLQTDAER